MEFAEIYYIASRKAAGFWGSVFCGSVLWYLPQRRRERRDIYYFSLLVIRWRRKKVLRMDAGNINEVSGEIIAAAIEVHKNVGPGLLESAYEACLCRELKLRNVTYVAQVPVPLVYKDEKLDCGYRLDLLVENSVIVELKASEKIQPIHKAQLLTYLKLMDRQLGLILNFNVPVMRDGIQRVVNN